MKAYPWILVVTLAAVLSVACSSNPPANQNTAANTNQPATSVDSSSNQPQPGTSNASAPQAASATATGEAKPAGKIDAVSLYTAQKCVGCHGTDGKGKVKGAPNFADPAWQQKESDAELVKAIKKGNVPKMPAYASKLSDDEVKALVAYVRTFSGK